jgi:ABC-type glycerol-3-phosphate transport system permease component
VAPFFAAILPTSATRARFTFAGYALSRFRTRLVTIYGRGLFMVQMFPILLALIPLFIFFRTLGLVNTYYSVIILSTVAQLPFATSMFRAFFDGIPNDLEEAAKNEYLIAAVFLRKESLYTVPIGIQQFIQQFSTDWGSLMAAAVLAMLPTFVLFLFIQKYMMYGAIGSGVKG